MTIQKIPSTANYLSDHTSSQHILRIRYKIALHLMEISVSLRHPPQTAILT